MKKIMLAAVLAFSCSIAMAQSPCDGRITDKLDHPMSIGAVPKPAPGGSYIDPVFGTTVTRITAADPSEGDKAIWKTRYSSMRAWNADGSYLILWHRGGDIYEIYQGDKPYGHLYQLVLAAVFINGVKYWPADLEQVMWDPVDPDVLYFPAGYGSSTHKILVKITLTPGSGSIAGHTATTQHDFNDLCTGSYASVNPLTLGSDPSDMSYWGSGATEKIVGLSCGAIAVGAVRLHILYSIGSDTVLATQPSTSQIADWAFAGGGGFYHSESGTVYDESYNVQRTIIWGHPNSYTEHASMGSTPGFESYNKVEFEEAGHIGNLISVRMNTGTVNNIISKSDGWPYTIHASHLSHGAANGSGWVAGGTIGTATGATVLDNEIYLANVMTGEVCRIAHARTYKDEFGSPWGYWSETHPSISNDGYRVAFTSDWMGSSTVDTYVVDLRTGAPPPPPPPTVTYTANISWVDNSTDEDGFRVERSDTSPPTTWQAVGSVAADVVTLADPGQPAGSSRCWRVVAFNADGEGVSPETCATAPTPSSPPAAPLAPLVTFVQE